MTAQASSQMGETAFGFWSPRPFRSGKTPEPITAATRMHEDWLSLASLDPDVASITAARPEGQAADDGGPTPDFEVVDASGRSSSVLVVPHDMSDAEKGALLDLVTGAASKGKAVRVVDHHEVGEEPRLTNVRLVFGCRRVRVSPGDRVRILHHLSENGPSPVVEVARGVLNQAEAVECILALVCEGSVMLDLDGTFGPETQVWRATREGEP